MRNSLIARSCRVTRAPTIRIAAQLSEPADGFTLRMQRLVANNAWGVSTNAVNHVKFPFLQDLGSNVALAV